MVFKVLIVQWRLFSKDQRLSEKAQWAKEKTILISEKTKLLSQIMVLRGPCPNGLPNVKILPTSHHEPNGGLASSSILGENAAGAERADVAGLEEGEALFAGKSSSWQQRTRTGLSSFSSTTTAPLETRKVEDQRGGARAEEEICEGSLDDGLVKAPYLQLVCVLLHFGIIRLEKARRTSR